MEADGWGWEGACAMWSIVVVGTWDTRTCGVFESLDPEDANPKIK